MLLVENPVNKNLSVDDDRPRKKKIAENAKDKNGREIPKSKMRYD